MATVIHNTADVLSITGKNQEAKPIYEEAITMRREIHGPKHPEVAETLNNYAGALLGLNMLDAALTAYNEAIEIRKMEYGSSDRKTLLVMKNKVMALDRMKRSDEATKLREEITQLEQRKNDN
jgi:tetratricopeptide (TPR) repeat protein